MHGRARGFRISKQRVKSRELLRGQIPQHVFQLLRHPVSSPSFRRRLMGAPF